MARANAKFEDELGLADEIVEVVGAAPPSIRCETCALWSAPSSDRAAVERIGGRWSGDCFLTPTAVKKLPEERCGQHSALVQQRQAEAAAAIAAAIAPAIERGLAAIAASVGAKG